jgi:dynein light chain LC8-type
MIYLLYQINVNEYNFNLFFLKELHFKLEKRYYKDLAEIIKKEFDNKFEDGSNGSWNVIVGKNFGAFVTYEANHVILFRINHLEFLIFKFG